MEQLPNCTACKHYYVTYETGRPYGCRAMGFKSKVSPAKVVYETSGMVCQLFEPKKKMAG
jgi:hypothetical protein